MGIPMGEPWFRCRDTFLANGGKAFSANYRLYGNLSARVMEVLREEEGEVEVYSIDEAFIRLAVPPHRPFPWGSSLSGRVGRLTGIPVSVGIAPSRTLAKLANLIAKKRCRGPVFDFSSCPRPDRLMADFSVHEIWGVGAKSAARLNRVGIRSALDFALAPDRRIRALVGLPGLMTATELRGTSCIGDRRPGKAKSMISSRSFGEKVVSREGLASALARHGEKIASRLRRQGLRCSSLNFKVFGCGERRREARVCSTVFDQPTASPFRIGAAARLAAEKLFVPQAAYSKAGVWCENLSPADCLQGTLFVPETKDDGALMEVIDRLGSRYGEGIIHSGASLGAGATRPRAEMTSAFSPDSWEALPTVQA